MERTLHLLGVKRFWLYFLLDIILCTLTYWDDDQRSVNARWAKRLTRHHKIPA